MTLSLKAHGGAGYHIRRWSSLATVALAAVVLLGAGSHSSAAEVPGSGHAILVFPSREMVNLTGYSTTDKVTVRLYHNGSLFTDTGPMPITPVVDTKDSRTIALGGQVLVNHAPIAGDPACWVGGPAFGAPPVPLVGGFDAGDVIVVTHSDGSQETSTVANVIVTQAATDMGGGTIVMKGTAAMDRAGTTPIPLHNLEARIIAKKGTFDISGGRELRTGNNGFTLAYDADGSIHWTATFSGLDAHDVLLATQSQSRILWLNDPTITTEATIYEKNLVTPGPNAPCTAAATIPYLP